MRPSAPAPRRLRAERLLQLILVTLILAECGRGWVDRSRPPPPQPGRLRVDLSTAPASLLRWLPGVGRVKAAAIVTDRERNGPLPSLEALDRVPGFGPATVESLRGTTEVELVVGASRVPEEVPDR